jgi:XTP/dITP diphosphohydrolase
MTRKILAASENPGKLRELRAITAELLEGVEVVTPKELSLVIAYPEEGDAYAPNAIGKAEAAARASGLPAIADDSGIEVEALEWGPGPASARYADSDEARIARLLAALGDRPPERRRARFRSVAACVLPDGTSLIAEGLWEGVILAERRGAGGFGYDPIFFDPEAGQCAAEMTPQEKAARSHRGKALRALALLLQDQSW